MSKLQEIRTDLRSDFFLKNLHADIAIILGSGIECPFPLENKVEVSYSELGYKYKKIEGHQRNFIFGEYKGKKIVLVSRLHYYEFGYCEHIIYMFKALKHVGVKTVILTTSAGGINKELKAGDVMLISDHINFTGINPLMFIKERIFVDMSNAYDKHLQELAKKVAEQKKIKLFSGVHIQFSGPSYETKAEIEMCRKWGADTVSMSTAFDCILANYHEMKVLAFAGVVNTAGSGDIVCHEEVLENAEKVKTKINKLIMNIIPKISE